MTILPLSFSPLFFHSIFIFPSKNHLSLSILLPPPSLHLAPTHGHGQSLPPPPASSSLLASCSDTRAQAAAARPPLCPAAGRSRGAARTPPCSAAARASGTARQRVQRGVREEARSTQAEGKDGTQDGAAAGAAWSCNFWLCALPPARVTGFSGASSLESESKLS